MWHYGIYTLGYCCKVLYVLWQKNFCGLSPNTTLKNMTKHKYLDIMQIIKFCLNLMNQKKEQQYGYLRYLKVKTN